jgi:hypothetical protein
MDAALAEYARAYDLSQRAGVGQESIREMFAPDTPVALPVFVRVRRGRAARTQTHRLWFEVDKYGRSRRVQVLGPRLRTRAVAKHVENIFFRADSGRDSSMVVSLTASA